jgi:hypothetical protein
VDGVGIVRYADAVSGQLLPESYRPATGDPGGFRQRGNAPAQLLRPVDGRLPDALPARRIQRGEDLAAPAVEDGERRALVSGLPDPPRQRVERADAANRQPEAEAEPARRRDPDPDAGEGAGPEPDREQVDRLPAAGGLRRPLDLGQEAGRVQRPPARGEPPLGGVQDLAVPPGAGDGVDRRGIEADDDQRRATP